MESTQTAADTDSMGRPKVPVAKRAKRTNGRGRPRLADPRSKVIPVRVNEAEWQGLAEAGQANGDLSPGAYLALVGRDAAMSRPLLPATVIGEMVAARKQVQMVGRNVNQIAAALNAGAETPANLAVVMDRLTDALDRLDVAVDAVADTYRSRS